MKLKEIAIHLTNTCESSAKKANGAYRGFCDLLSETKDCPTDRHFYAISIRSASLIEFSNELLIRLIREALTANGNRNICLPVTDR